VFPRQQLVQDAINKLMVDRTVIIIAHRLSTVRDADLIAVFGKGKIVDAGKHETLLRTSKVYANLVRKQLSSAHSMHAGPGESASEGGGDASQGLTPEPAVAMPAHEGGLFVRLGEGALGGDSGSALVDLDDGDSGLA
jgi:ABC-type multidrug transport system ATPase subunit